MKKISLTSIFHQFTKEFVSPLSSLSTIKWMKYFFTLLFFIAGNVEANQQNEVICSYAPSQSNKIANLTAVAGSSAIASAVIAASGLTVTAVAHSSGAYILTGTSGYIAGTLGTTTSAVTAAPVIIGVGLIVGGAAVTVELICARKNHPEQVKRIEAAAAEFSSRFVNAMADTKIAAENFKKLVEPAANSAAINVKKIASDAWKYSYQKGSSLAQEIQK